MKLKQIELISTKNTPSSSDERFYIDYFILLFSVRLFDILRNYLILRKCGKFFVANSVTELECNLW